MSVTSLTDEQLSQNIEGSKRRITKMGAEVDRLSRSLDDEQEYLHRLNTEQKRRARAVQPTDLAYVKGLVDQAVGNLAAAGAILANDERLSEELRQAGTAIWQQATGLESAYKALTYAVPDTDER